MILMLLGQVDGSKVKQKTADRFELIRKVYEQQKAMADCERNIVESRNGIVKRRFGLDLILAYLPETAETEATLPAFHHREVGEVLLQ